MSHAKTGPWLSLILLCGILHLRSALCQSANPGAEAPLAAEKAKQLLRNLENHWLQVEDDPDALESILAADFLHVVPAGIITKNEQLKFMREHPAPHGKPEKRFENMHVRVYGAAGIVNGVVVTAEGGVTHRTLFTDVFAYRDGKWSAVNAQETPEGRPPQ